MRSASGQAGRDRSARFRGSPSAPAPTAPRRGSRPAASKKPGPAAVARGAANSSQRVAPRSCAGQAAVRSPAGSREGCCSPGDAQAPPATRDKGLATQLTTFLFYFCSCVRNSRAGVNVATRSAAQPRFRRGSASISRTTARVARADTPNAMWLQCSSTALSRSSGSPRADARRRSRPAATTRRKVGTGGLAVIRGIGGVVDLVPRDPFVQPPDIVLPGIARKGRAERDHRAHPVGHGPRQLAREQPAEAPADQQHRALVIDLRRAEPASRSSSVGGAPQVPAHAATDGPASPPRRARGAAPSSPRSDATKPGMTSAGGPSPGPRGRRWPKPRHRRGHERSTRLSPQPAPIGRVERECGRRSKSSALTSSRGTRRPSAPGAPPASRTRPSAVWWFSSSGTRMRGRCERGIVERVGEPHLAVGAAVAKVRPPRLPVVQRRAAVGLAIFA